MKAAVSSNCHPRANPLKTKVCFLYGLWHSLFMGRGQRDIGASGGATRRQVLDFIVPFDGASLPVEREREREREREQVSSQFSALITDTLLNHAVEVEHRNIGVGRPHDHLSLRVPSDREHGAEWSVSVDQDTEQEAPSDRWESFEEVKASITIQRIKGHCGRETFSYRLGSDGVVRRWDGGDAYAKAEERRAAGFPDRYADERTSIEELKEMTERNLEELSNSITNSRLETEMGFNNQPISLKELEGLTKFLSQPGFEVPAWARRVKSPSLP